LVEVVLALGIVSFGLLGVFAVFSVSLQSNSEVISQYESFGANRALPAFFQQQVQQSGFNTVYGWVQSPATAPTVYAYMLTNTSSASTNLQTSIRLGTDTALSGEIGRHDGRLFRVVFAISPNMPIVNTSGVFVPRPTASDLPASYLNYTNGVLAVQAKLYAVPAVNVLPANTAPALTFDTTINRF
jgi:hypothetical protein